MKPETRERFLPLTDKFEGNVRYMYTDAYGLVTTGRGNLIDFGLRRVGPTDPLGNASPAPAVHLPWKLRDGTRAAPEQVTKDWWLMKHMWPQVRSVSCGLRAGVWLDQADVDQLTFAKLDEVWAGILAKFPSAESWPAPAQLGVVSMAWAMGVHGFDGFPVFCSLADVGHWAGAAQECTMRGAGVEPRNVANRALFIEAAAQP